MTACSGTALTVDFVNGAGREVAEDDATVVRTAAYPADPTGN
jgi:hypothetical protein